MSNNRVLNTILKNGIFCVLVLLLVALGFLLWIIRVQHYEIISLRNENISSRSDLEVPDDLYMPPKIAPLPFKEDFDFEEDDLPISVSGPRQDALGNIAQFPRKKQNEGQSGHSGQDGTHAAKEMPAYYEQLNAFIRPKWNAVAPSRAELDEIISTWPIIDLDIAKDGRVTKVVIIRKSGNNAIDAAVETLLLGLKVVPDPPQAVAIRVTLDIR